MKLNVAQTNVCLIINMLSSSEVNNDPLKFM